MRGLRNAALLGAGLAAVSVSVASTRPRRSVRAGKAARGAVDWAEDGGLGEFTIWPPPPTAGHHGRGRRGG